MKFWKQLSHILVTSKARPRAAPNWARHSGRGFRDEIIFGLPIKSMAVPVTGMGGSSSHVPDISIGHVHSCYGEHAVQGWRIFLGYFHRDVLEESKIFMLHA
jgi:hypothetical protein